MRRLIPLLLLSGLGCGTLFASGAWNFHGGAGLNAGRVDNPGFVGTRNASYDPNAPQCDPNDAAFDPQASICDRNTPGSRRRSDTNGTLRLTGGVTGQWAGTRFNLSYSPVATYFYDQTEFSQVSHSLTSNWNHAYSARSTVTIDALAHYTPEQDVDPNGYSTNRIFVDRTNQLSGGLRAGYAFAATAKTMISGTYRYAIRTFGSDEFVDSSTHSAGINWRRRVTARSFVQSGYEYGQFLYGDGPSTSDPNNPAAVRSRDFDSMHHQASAGYGVDMGRGFKVTANAGYNILQPVDSRLESTSGLYLNAQADWTGTKLSASTGYVRSLAEGSGAFANAKADSLRGNVRYAFGPKVSTDLSLARNVNERVAGGTNQGGESVRTIYARASLNWAFADAWSANASYARFTQSQSGAPTGTPDIRSNRWSAGISWSIQ